MKLRAASWLLAVFFASLAFLLALLHFERGRIKPKSPAQGDFGGEVDFDEYRQSLLAHQALLAKEAQNSAEGEKYVDAVVRAAEKNFVRGEFLRREKGEACGERERRSKSAIFGRYSPYALEGFAPGRQGEFDAQDLEIGGIAADGGDSENFATSVQTELKILEKAAEIDFLTDGARAGAFSDSAGAAEIPSVFAQNDVAAFYGNPKSPAMGILGRLSFEELDGALRRFAAEIDAANGERGAIPCVHLVYGTCWKGGEIGLLDGGTVEKYIEFAKARGWLVVLDHQIGGGSVKGAVEKMLPFLRHENVHLAIDPEWRTDRPNEEIGSVDASEINEAKSLVESHLERIGGGRRFLAVHQFSPKMIRNPEKISAGGGLCEIVHCMDGFGPPELKRASYAMNALAKQIPAKAFKLFSKPAIEGAGYDKPMMSAADVMALRPKPVFVILQ